MRALLVALLLLGIAIAGPVAPTASAMHACLDLQVECLHLADDPLCQPALKRIPGWWNTFCR